jgi:hypothetical protein
MQVFDAWQVFDIMLACQVFEEIPIHQLFDVDPIQTWFQIMIKSLSRKSLCMWVNSNTMLWI